MKLMYDVYCGPIYTVERIQELITEGFGYWRFPDNQIVHIFPLPTHPDLIGQTLIWDDGLKQFYWSPIMSESWRPVKTHPDKPEP